MLSLIRKQIAVNNSEFEGSNNFNQIGETKIQKGETVMKNSMTKLFTVSVSLAVFVCLVFPAQVQSQTIFDVLSSPEDLEVVQENFISQGITNEEEYIDYYSSVVESTWQQVQDEWNTSTAQQKDQLISDFESYIGSVEGISQSQAETLAENFETALQSNAQSDIDTYVQSAGEVVWNEVLKDAVAQAMQQQSGVSPGSPQIRVADNLMQKGIFQKAKPEAPMVEGVRSIMEADLFADFWEYDDGREGTTYGLNPSFTFGEKTQVTVTAPMYFEDPDNADDNYTIGLDGRLSHNLTQDFAIGVHANYLNQHRENFLDFNEDSETLTIGPFASYNLTLSEKVNLTLGGLVDYTNHLESDVIDDDTWLGAAGANLGIKLTEQIAVNPYAVYYADLESDSPVDDDFVDVGAEIAANLSETWSVTAGVKTTLEYEDYESYEVYLGSAWNF